MNRTTDWLSENSGRAYPIRDDTTDNVSLWTTGFAELAIPTAMLLDAGLRLTRPYSWAAGTNYQERHCLHLVGCRFGSGGWAFRFIIGSGGADLEGPSWTLVVPTARPVYYTATQTNDYGTLTVVFGDTPNTVIANVDYLGRIPLDPAVITPAYARDVHTVVDEAGNNTAGTVLVSPGYNCDVLVTASTLTLRTGRGFGAGKPCMSEPLAVSLCTDAVFTMNGQTPDDSGDITLKITPGALKAVDGKLIAAVDTTKTC